MNGMDPQQAQLTAASSVAEVSNHFAPTGCSLVASLALTWAYRGLQHLSSPPALTRIPLLRARIQKERASLQSSLSGRAKEQVDSVREGLHSLKEVRTLNSASHNDFPECDVRGPVLWAVGCVGVGRG